VMGFQCGEQVSSLDREKRETARVSDYRRGKRDHRPYQLCPASYTGFGVDRYVLVFYGIRRGVSNFSDLLYGFTLKKETGNLCFCIGQPINLSQWLWRILGC